jgi:hypothetical protein
MRKRKFVDTTIFTARNIAEDGNIDYKYWFDKSHEEKLTAAARMIEVSFQEPQFLEKKVDRKLFRSFKRPY